MSKASAKLAKLEARTAADDGPEVTSERLTELLGVCCQNADTALEACQFFIPTVWPNPPDVAEQIRAIRDPEEALVLVRGFYARRCREHGWWVQDWTGWDREMARRPDIRESCRAAARARGVIFGDE